jgi:hydrogenase maturation protease
MKSDTLIIGFGNADRQDDGVGWHIIHKLADRIHQPTPDDPGAAIEIEHETVDLLYILQIYPELAETLSHYRRVCFVDAHTGDIEEEIVWQNITPAYEKSPLTHHMSPSTVLSITAMIYDNVPEACLLSVRGYHFQFNRRLSPKTTALAETATHQLWQWITKSPSKSA